MSYSKIPTPLEVRRAKGKATPYRLRFGKGLVLEVRPTGSKIWRYRYRWPLHDQGTGRPVLDAKDKPVLTERLFTIGEFGDGPDQFSIEAAQEERGRLRKLIRRGVNPEQERKNERKANIEESANTFKAVAEEWFSDNKAEWSEKYQGQVRAGLDNDIYPAIGERPIKSVTSADVLAILKSKKETPTWAILLRQWIGAVMKYAMANKRADVDPTYAVRNAIKRPTVKHHAPLQVKELPALLTALAGDTGGRHVAIGLELLMLTFVRPNEMRKAEWTEFDLEAATFRVPGKRMKSGQDHYVPLSRQALALLRELHARTGKGRFLFPHQSDPKKPMSETAFNLLLNRHGYTGRFTPHGFRATASSALNGMGFRSDLIERQLSHAERDKTRASYNQQEWWSERTAMMQTWADVIYSTAKGNVIPIRAEATA